MLNKIGVIGAGWIGGVLVQEIVQRGLAKTVAVTDPAPFVDESATPERQEVLRKQSVSKGKALDILEGSPLFHHGDAKIQASKEYDVLDGCDMIINTAGVPRKARPDGSFPSREELLTINLKVTNTVAEAIGKYCKNAMIISLANPLDAIVYTLNKRLGPPKNKLVGMAGVLDSSRLRYFLAQAAGVSIDNVEALVLGGHGDNMVPVRSCCRIAGMPVEKFIPEDKLQAIETRTRKAGGEVVGLLGFGSAFASPAYSAIAMAEAIIYDKKILASCALLEGEYGVKGMYVGVPCILGSGGVEKVIEVELTSAEQANLEKSIAGVKKTCDEVDKMLG